MKTRTFAAASAGLGGAVLATVLFAQEAAPYVATRKIDHMDDYHGTKVADPYRWLEDETSPETAAWIEAQNAVTFPYLERIPYREALRARVMELNDYERYGAPARKGPYFFFSKNEGLQNQSVLHIQEGLDGAPEVLLDPNAWSADGTVQLSAFEPSKDAKYAVYGISQSGSDWQQYKVMELATKRTLEDNVEWAKVSQVAWHGDGFYYSRYPEPPEGPREGVDQREPSGVLPQARHAAGGRHARVRGPREPAALPYASTTEDERFAILEVSDRGKGLDGNALYVRDLTDPDGKFAPLVPEITNDTFYVVDNVGDRILVATNHGAPNWRVVLIDPANIAEANWKTVLAERPEPIDSVTTAGGKLFATYLKDVATRAYVFSLDGTLENEIALPGLGTAGGFSGPNDSPFVFYTFNSLSVPPTIYRYDIATRASSVFRAPNVPGYDAAQFETKQVFYPSKDGTRIPMFLVYRKGLQLDGNNPTLLYGYGGFNIVVSPTFSAARIALLEQGLRVCLGQPARRRRVRRGVAPAGHEARQAERVRRLHRGGRVAHRAEVHVVGAARDHGPVERRAARRRRDEPAARAVRRRGAGSRRHGHAALPQVHDRLELDRGLRLERRRRGVQGAVRVLAAAQHPAGREVSRRR